jgi:hypothetical protein
LSSKFTYQPETGLVFSKRSGKRAGYAQRSSGRKKRVGVTIDGGKYVLSRIIWMIYHGQDPGELTVDHIDQNPLNNRIDNLRLLTNHEQQKNRPRQHNCKYYPGVELDSREGKKPWRARIGSSKMGNRKELGNYDTIFDAACARISAQNAAGYDDNHGSIA